MREQDQFQIPSRVLKGKRYWVVGAFLFRALNFRSDRAAGREGSAGGRKGRASEENKNEATLRKILALETAVTSWYVSADTVAKHFSRRFAFITRHFRSLQKRGVAKSTTRSRGIVPRACREAWQEMSHAPEGITTREAGAWLVFHRWHIPRETDREPRRNIEPLEKYCPLRDVRTRCQFE